MSLNYSFSQIVNPYAQDLGYLDVRLPNPAYNPTGYYSIAGIQIFENKTQLVRDLADLITNPLGKQNVYTINDIIYNNLNNNIYINGVVYNITPMTGYVSGPFSSSLSYTNAQVETYMQISSDTKQLTPVYIKQVDGSFDSGVKSFTITSAAGGTVQINADGTAKATVGELGLTFTPHWDVSNITYQSSALPVGPGTLSFNVGGLPYSNTINLGFNANFGSWSVTSGGTVNPYSGEATINSSANWVVNSTFSFGPNSVITRSAGGTLYMPSFGFSFTLKGF